MHSIRRTPNGQTLSKSSHSFARFLNSLRIDSCLSIFDRRCCLFVVVFISLLRSFHANRAPVGLAIFPFSQHATASNQAIRLWRCVGGCDALFSLFVIDEAGCRLFRAKADVRWIKFRSRCASSAFRSMGSFGERRFRRSKQIDLVFGRFRLLMTLRRHLITEFRWIYRLAQIQWVA